jgi:hypothetical protein
MARERATRTAWAHDPRPAAAPWQRVEPPKNHPTSTTFPVLTVESKPYPHSIQNRIQIPAGERGPPAPT